MISRVLFSSAKHDWETPWEFFRLCSKLFGPFDLDAAASEHNALCDRFFSREDNALVRTWIGSRVWCNPPYGRDIHKWVSKAFVEVANGNAGSVAMLVPARTDVAWFHRLIFCNPFDVWVQVYFVLGRLLFGSAGSSHSPAPFPSMVIHVFRGEPEPMVSFYPLGRDIDEDILCKR